MATGDPTAWRFLKSLQILWKTIKLSATRVPNSFHIPGDSNLFYKKASVFITGPQDVKCGMDRRFQFDFVSSYIGDSRTNGMHETLAVSVKCWSRILQNGECEGSLNFQVHIT